MACSKAAADMMAVGLLVVWGQVVGVEGKRVVGCEDRDGDDVFKK